MEDKIKDLLPLITCIDWISLSQKDEKSSLGSSGKDGRMGWFTLIRISQACGNHRNHRIHGTPEHTANKPVIWLPWRWWMACDMERGLLVAPIWTQYGRRHQHDNSLPVDKTSCLFITPKNAITIRTWWWLLSEEHWVINDQCFSKEKKKMTVQASRQIYCFFQFQIKVTF